MATTCSGYGGTDKIREINCTGGGVYKFRDIVKDKLGIELVPSDEMRSMIRGLNFLLRNTKNEIFCFNSKTKKVGGLSLPQVFDQLNPAWWSKTSSSSSSSCERGDSSRCRDICH